MLWDGGVGTRTGEMVVRIAMEADSCIDEYVGRTFETEWEIERVSFAGLEVRDVRHFRAIEMIFDVDAALTGAERDDCLGIEGAGASNREGGTERAFGP